MIVTKTPLRVSLVGGGTDLPMYYEKTGLGEVISLSIDRYIYITSSRYHDKTATCFKYSEVEVVKKHSEIRNPIVREVLSYFEVPSGYEFSSVSNVPGGTGLGSSSAFSVGLIMNVATALGQPMSQLDAAALACHIELNVLQEPIGKQDQYGCAIGGIKHVVFREHEVNVSSVQMTTEARRRLDDSLVLIRVGNIRSASEILRGVQSQPDVNFGKLDKIRGLVSPVKSLLSAGDMQGLGEALHEYWILKKTLSQGISDSSIDSIYEYMVPRFAYGGKLLGAGGAGFLCFILRNPEERNFGSHMTPKVESLNIDFDGVRAFCI